MKDKYYIYYHIDPRTQLPVYIGKGSGGRAWEFGKSRRNSRHYKWLKELKNINLEPVVFIGKSSNNEDEIFQIEELDIITNRKIGVKLYNIDSGGKKRKTEPKNKKQTICVNNNVVYDSISDAGLALSLKHITNISAVCRGIQRSYRGYKFEYLDVELREKAELTRKERQNNKERARFKKGNRPWNKGIKNGN